MRLEPRRPVPFLLPRPSLAGLLLLALLFPPPDLSAEEATGLAPEVVDLSPKSISWAAEKQLPDLPKPYIGTAPTNLKDGIPVGSLGNALGNGAAILKFADEIAAGQHGDVDSLLIMHRGRLIFESYFRRGRINYPHFQMSITKSYTAMAIGRAIRLGYLTMADLDRPVVSFLNNLDRGKLAPGAEGITLAEAMNMRSGVRLPDGKAKDLSKHPDALRGQGQIQTYLENSAPIPPPPREFKYQESDPSMVMQVLESVVPGGARNFIEKEVFGKLGITDYTWETDVSGLPKAAAGSNVRSRDMMKWGMLVMNRGVWNGEQLIPAEFVEKATSAIYTNPQNVSYGFFWWRQNVASAGRNFDQKSARGANGQFIQVYPELDLVIVITAHDQGMGKMLTAAPERIIPSFTLTAPPMPSQASPAPAASPATPLPSTSPAARVDQSPSPDQSGDRELAALLNSTLDYYGKLQRTPNGLYRDAYPTDGRPRGHLCSIAATGIGLIALCIDHDLGRDPSAGQKALQTLKAINGKSPGFQMNRDRSGYFRHFFSDEDGSGKSEFSTIDTAIMVVGALFCRNTFHDPQIRSEADQLWNSIDWNAALADPTGRRLYMVFAEGKPVDNKITRLFNEYYILAWLIRESQLQKTGHSDVVTFRDLGTWDNRGIRLLCADGPFPQCSFLIQFPFYMCHPCTMDPLFREFVAAQARADQRACSERVGVQEYWGCGAGGSPSAGYRANSYKNNPDNMVSPHIIAGFMPAFPTAREHLLKLARDPVRRVGTPVGDLLPRFSVNHPEWRAPRVEPIDYSSMLFGLAGIDPRLGMKFFADKSEFTFNRPD